MAPRKSHPKGIDPAYPQKNFVDAAYDNHNETKEHYYEEVYGMHPYPSTTKTRETKAANYGHSVGQRAGKLRLSGMPGAHRIGKRSK